MVQDHLLTSGIVIVRVFHVRVGTAIPTGWQNLGFLDGANSATYTPPVAINQNTTYAVYVTPTGVHPVVWVCGPVVVQW